MVIKTAAQKAKTKFKKAYWEDNKEKFNIIGICKYNESNDDGYYIIAYIFDMKDAENLPKDIDGVEVKYIPVFEETKQ